MHMRTGQERVLAHACASTQNRREVGPKLDILIKQQIVLVVLCSRAAVQHMKLC